MNNSKFCYCGSQLDFQECCQKYILGFETAPTALALMKSRYSAYVVQNTTYLLETTHESTRSYYSIEELHQWASENQWKSLEIINFSETIVAFKAHYIGSNKDDKIHKEKSVFIKENGHWFYVEGFNFD